MLDIPVEIRVQATFKRIDCTADDGSLGQAGTVLSVMDFSGAPLTGTWYPVALAKSIAGTELFPGVPDIVAEFNSDIGTAGCLETFGWYYGLDNQHGDLVDLVTLALHEFAHGLGFTTFVDDGGAELDGSPRRVRTADLRCVLAEALGRDDRCARRRTSAVDAGGLTWDGAAVRSAVPTELTPLPLTVTAPPQIAGDYTVGTATFSGDVTEAGVDGLIVQALDPADPTDPRRPTPARLLRMPPTWPGTSQSSTAEAAVS